MKVMLLRHTSEPEKLIATAARLCYSKDTVDDIINNFSEDSIDRFITLLSDLGHESPFEHVNFTFSLEDVSRSLTHQLVRHRLASYSQKSQRYVTEGQFSYVIPPEIKGDRNLESIYVNSMEEDQDNYNKIFHGLIVKYIREKHADKMEEMLSVYCDYNSDAIKHWYVPMYGSTCKHNLEKFKEAFKKEYNIIEKLAAEDARFILPNSCSTSIILSMNIRSLYNFFNNRCCERAQWEIREVANTMLKEVRIVSPTLFKSAGRPCIGLGYCPENNMQCDKFKGVIPTHSMIQILIKQWQEDK